MKPLQIIAILLLFLSIFVPTYAQKLKPVDVTLMSFNVQHGVSNDGKTNLLKIVELIKKYKPDAVLIQEIDSGVVKSGKLNQLKTLSLLTGYEPIFGGINVASGGKTGLGILTKHPYDNLQIVPLPAPETSEEKLMLSVVLKLPNFRSLRLCNVQLDEKLSLNRGIQAAVMNKTLEMSQYPIVWAGDFVDSVEDPTLDFLSKKWDDAGAEQDLITHLPTQTRRSFFWTLKNSNVTLCEYKVLSEPNLSAHQPLMATFEIR